MVKLLANADVTSSPQKSQVGLFLGDQSAIIRTMAAVKSTRLEINHSFQLKEILQICIGEEGNMWQIKLKTMVTFLAVHQDNTPHHQPAQEDDPNGPGQGLSLGYQRDHP
jgi:hypothetical protein